MNAEKPEDPGRRHFVKMLLLAGGAAAAGYYLLRTEKQPAQELQSQPSQESIDDTVKEQVGITFVLAKHGSPEDLKPIIDEIGRARASDPYTHLLIDGSVSEQYAKGINENLAGWIHAYHENYSIQGDQLFKEDLAAAITGSGGIGFADVVAEMYLMCAKNDMRPSFIETYNTEESRKLIQLKRDYKEVKRRLIHGKGERTELVEQYCDLFAQRVAYRNKRLVENISAFRSNLEDGRIMVAMGPMHKGVVQHFEGCQVVEPHYEVMDLPWSQVVLKKIENPSYRMNEKEWAQVAKNIFKDLK